MARTLLILAAAFSIEVALLGYGIYPFIDRRGNSLLLLPAVLTIVVTNVLLRGVWRTMTIVLSGVGVSLAAAVAMARGSSLAVLFYPGVTVMFALAGLIETKSEYDPIGHPLLWGTGVAVNSVVVALILGAVAKVLSIARRRVAAMRPPLVKG